MKIIRDEQLLGFGMIPLFAQWGIRRCNVSGCKNVPTTIVTQLAPGVAACGFCEDHYQEANKPGGAKYTLDFDDFDAFKQREERG